MEARINAVSYYLPDQVLDNAKLNELFPEWSVDKISSKTGIYKRHIAASNEFVSDMAIQAAKNLFSEHNISPGKIDFILLCTQSPDFFLPTTACLVQHALGIPTTAGALDFNLGCSGYVYGLNLAKGIIYSEEARNVLLITSETYSKFIHQKDKSNRTIFGDAATATLISTDGGFARIKKFVLGTDGSGANNLIVKNGALRHPIALKESMDHIDNFGNVHNDNNLFMDGAEIFNFTATSVPALVKSVLAKNESEESEIALYIFHQANKYMLNHLRKKLNIGEDRFFYFLESCGNTVSSTLPIALAEAKKQDRLHGNILLAGFGVGYSWGSCIIECIDQ